MGVSARAIGMGEAYTALSDDTAGLYWNPAGITQVDRLSVIAMHNIWLSNFTHDYAGMVYPLKRHNQAIGIQAAMLTHTGIKVISTGEIIKRPIWHWRKLREANRINKRWFYGQEHNAEIVSQDNGRNSGGYRIAVPEHAGFVGSGVIRGEYRARDRR